MFKIKLKEFYIFMLPFTAYLVLSALYPFLIPDIIKFISFQVLFLLLPGYIFSKWFISEKLTGIQKLIFGYPVSLVTICILSWIGKSLTIKYLECVILLFSLVSVYEIIKERKEKGMGKGIPVFTGMFIYSACIIIVFRLFIIPSSPPVPGRLGLFYQDSLWNLGLTWSYIRGFPLQDSKFTGVLTGYHMLKHIYQGTVFEYTRIDPFSIHFFIEPIFDWFIMVFLIFFGGIKIAKFTLRKIAIFCVGLFFGTAFLGGGLQGTLIVNPLTTYFSIPGFILFIFYIIGYSSRQKELDVVYMTVLYIYFTSTKSMLGIIIAVVLFILFILNLFKKSIPFSYKQILLGMGLFLSAMLIKFTMIRHSMHTLSFDYDTTTSFAYGLFKKIAFISNYIDIIYPFYRFWSSFFRNLPQYILNWPVLLFLIVVFSDKEFRGKIKTLNTTLAFIITFFLVAISMMSLVDFPGIRIYFFWYVQVVFLILGVVVLDYILSTGNKLHKFIAFSLVILSMAISARGLIQWVRLGWGASPEVKERIWDKRASISYDEWLGMKWLKTNTDINSIFFSDRRYFAHELIKDDKPRFYGYSALSGRQAFAEGETSECPASYKAMANGRWDLINSFLSSVDPVSQEELLHKITADYFIQSLRFDKNNFSKVGNLQLVYENNDTKIYKIKKYNLQK